MQANRPNIEALKQAMKFPLLVRNVCILAHVDHGKTTIADSLLATNGLVSKRSAGQIRYLDDRHDEQKRGITMKSSAVSLYYPIGSDEMVLNLIDTPGHIDFSTEVSAAVRICDGALIVVDLVEGICVQTRDAIKQAYDEHVKMILVLNKMDRLVLELHQSAEVMFQTILRVIEDCNVIITELCRYDVESNEEADAFLFSPDRGNVIFGSASDGWAVTTKSLSEAFFDLIVGETPESLQKKLWTFDNYIESDSRRIVTGAIRKQKHNVFIQLFLKSIYYLYHSFVIRMERDKLSVILQKFKITEPTRDMNHKCPRLQVKAILQAWSSIGPVIMKQCFDIIPSPGNIDEGKLRHLVYGGRQFENKQLSECMDTMMKKMRGTIPNACIIYISKMFSVNKNNLSQNKPKVFIPTRRVEKLERSDKPTAASASENIKLENVDDIKRVDRDVDNLRSIDKIETAESKSECTVTVNNSKSKDAKSDDKIESENIGDIEQHIDEMQQSIVTALMALYKPDDDIESKNVKTDDNVKSEDVEPRSDEIQEGAFHGISKVDNGIESKGTQSDSVKSEKGKDAEMQSDKSEKVEDAEIQNDKVQENPVIALGRVFGGTLKTGDSIYILSPDYKPSQNSNFKETTVKELYMMLGRELFLTDEIPHGNICGIGGLDDIVLRTATLSSTSYCLPLNERVYMEPIVRNTIEPVNTKDLPKLRQALKYLTQSDSCLQIITQETGEHVLVTAGDVHLAKCLHDLKTKFIDFDINISKPMVSLRETIYLARPYITNVDIQEFGLSFKTFILPLPENIQIFIQANHDLLQTIENRNQDLADASEYMKNVINRLKDKLKDAFSSCSILWDSYADKVWSIGKGRHSYNLLINNTSDYQRDIFTNPNPTDMRTKYDHHMVNGFQIFCRAGPICEEPLTNCAFIIEDYHRSNPEQAPSARNAQALANIPLIVKNWLREAFLKHQPRLVEPMFTTDITVTVHILGKVYSVVGRRYGKVLEAVGMDEDQRTFTVKALIPVVESDGFANEIRKATSGQANPTLRFSHYQMIEADPYFEGEEDEEDDDACAYASRANKLMKKTRRRKGLLTDEQIVVHAEKQRTLNKKK